MSQYDTEVDLSVANNSQTQAVDLIGEGKDVLDVGCWKGDLGQALASRGCRVTGVDVDEEAVEAARQVMDEVHLVDLETTRLSTCFAPGSFDVVVFADVLEHLLDPRAVLSDAATLLRPGGHVVLSIPNVTHGSVRLALLQGRWDYTDAGLLDRTHIRFFSRTGLEDLLRSSGYVVDELRATVLDVLSREVRYDHDALPAGLIEWVRDQPDALTFQFIVLAHPSSDASTAPLPPLEPVEPLATVRAVDRYTEQAEVERSKDHRLLTQRDHVLGLEATTAAAEARAAAAESGLDDRLERKKETIERLRERARRAERRVAAAGAAAADAPAEPVRRSTAARVAGRLRPGRDTDE